MAGVKEDHVGDDPLTQELHSPEVDREVGELKQLFLEHDPSQPWVPRMRMHRKGQLLAEIKLRPPADEDDTINCVTEAAFLAMLGRANRVLFAYDASAVIDGTSTDAFCVALITTRGIAGAIMPYTRADGPTTYTKIGGNLDLNHSPDIIDLNHAFAIMAMTRSSTHTFRSSDVDVLMATLAKRGHDITWYGHLIPKSQMHEWHA